MGLLTPERSREEIAFRETQRTLRSYHTMIEDQLAKLPRDLTADELRGSPFPQPEEIRGLLLVLRKAARQVEVDVTFPQIARRSFIVTIASEVEDQTKAVCEALHAFKSLPLRWNDLKGNTLDRLHAYAFKLAGLAAPPADVWQKARWLEQIRDCIVHGNGDVARSRDADALRKLVGKVPGYSISDGGRVRLTADTCAFFVDVFSALFEHVYAQADFAGTPIITPASAARSTTFRLGSPLDPSGL
jgi:hypothetical protein